MLRPFVSLGLVAILCRLALCQTAGIHPNGRIIFPFPRQISASRWGRPVDLRGTVHALGLGADEPPGIKSLKSLLGPDLGLTQGPFSLLPRTSNAWLENKIEPSQPADTNLFTSTAQDLRFDLTGSIVEIAAQIADVDSRRGVMELFRGYWAPTNHPGVQIFYGFGARFRYKVSGFRLIDNDHFARYWADTDFADPQKIGLHRWDLYVETFGVPVGKSPDVLLPVRATTFSKAILKLNDEFMQFATPLVESNPDQYEAIAISLPPEMAQSYEQNSVRSLNLTSAVDLDSTADLLR